MIDPIRMAAFIDANRQVIIADFESPDGRCSALSRWSRWIFERVVVPDPIHPGPVPPTPVPPLPVPQPGPDGPSVFDDNEADFPPLDDADRTGEWANGVHP